MFWNLLRTYPERFTAYCEPRHELLLDLVDNPGLIPQDRTHSDAEDPFAEYGSLDRSHAGFIVATMVRGENNSLVEPVIRSSTARFTAWS